MITDEWTHTHTHTHTHTYAPFVAFYDMRAVMFVLPDEMADVSIAGLQWFILIPRLNHAGSHWTSDSLPNPIYIEKKIVQITCKM